MARELPGPLEAMLRNVCDAEADLQDVLEEQKAFL